MKKKKVNEKQQKELKSGENGSLKGRNNSIDGVNQNGNITNQSKSTSNRDWREYFGLGPIYDYYSPKEGEKYKLKSPARFNNIKNKETKLEILQLISIVNRNGLGLNRHLANVYMNTVESPMYDNGVSPLVHEGYREAWRFRLLDLMEEHIEEISSTSSEGENWWENA